MFTLNCKGQLLTWLQPIVMGIVNATPDSFYSGSRIYETDAVVSRVEKMIRDGVTIVDIGGQSTRPGSQKVSVDEELNRVIPIITKIHEQFPELLISIDTFYAKVAREAVIHGASLVNDVSAGTLDEQLIDTVAEMNVPYVLMHMPGTPQNMQQMSQYKNVTLEVFDYLNRKSEFLRTAGVKDIIIDPGFGFGKTIKHNFTLLHELTYLQQLGKPILAGLSRKSTVYKTLQIQPEEALNGTTALHMIALMNGTTILRVHDVKEAVEAVQLYMAYK